MLNRISVVIPTYNDWDTVERAIVSALNQSFTPLEIILIDDGGSLRYRGYLFSLVKKFSDYPLDIKVLINEKNKGPSWSRNKGWDASSGDYVAFLDADDAWHIHKLQVQIDVMRQTGCDVLGVKAIQLTSASDSVRNEFPSIRTDLIYHCSLFRFVFRNKYTTTSGVIVLRSLRSRFDSDRRYSEDYHFWLSLLASGYNLMYLDYPLTYYFKSPYGELGLSASIKKMGLAELSNYIDLYDSGNLKLPVFIAAYFYSSVKFFIRMVISVFR